MKTPVCTDCIRNGAICPNCEPLHAAGKITKLDFEVASILAKINERYNISGAEFSRAVSFGPAVVIFTSGNPGLLIGRNGRVVSELSSALGKKVRVVKEGTDIKASIADIIAPAMLLGVNTIFRPGGIEGMKVRIQKSDTKVPPVDAVTLCAAISRIVGKEVEIVFE
jgi:transcription antitermination factor NusA-like protein